MRVRIRALAVVLPVTAGDYLLWNWSVAGSHDVVALASGMTLLPLVAISLGLIGLGALRLVALMLARSRTIARAVHPASARTTAASRQAERPIASAAERRSPSERKLAA